MYFYFISTREKISKDMLVYSIFFYTFIANKNKKMTKDVK